MFGMVNVKKCVDTVNASGRYARRDIIVRKMRLTQEESIKAKIKDHVQYM